MIAHDLELVPVQIGLQLLIEDTRLDADDTVLQAVVVDVTDQTDAMVTEVEDFSLNLHLGLLAHLEFHLDDTDLLLGLHVVDVGHLCFEVGVSHLLHQLIWVLKLTLTELLQPNLLNNGPPSLPLFRQLALKAEVEQVLLDPCEVSVNLPDWVDLRRVWLLHQDLKNLLDVHHHMVEFTHALCQDTEDQELFLLEKPIIFILLLHLCLSELIKRISQKQNILLIKF